MSSQTLRDLRSRCGGRSGAPSFQYGSCMDKRRQVFVTELLLGPRRRERRRRAADPAEDNQAPHAHSSPLARKHTVFASRRPKDDSWLVETVGLSWTGHASIAGKSDDSGLMRRTQSNPSSLQRNENTARLAFSIANMRRRHTIEAAVPEAGDDEKDVGGLVFLRKDGAGTQREGAANAARKEKRRRAPSSRIFAGEEPAAAAWGHADPAAVAAALPEKTTGRATVTLHTTVLPLRHRQREVAVPLLRRTLSRSASIVWCNHRRRDFPHRCRRRL
ncbi:unnamed protein product [Phaeothamnion confervicola]